MARGRELAGRAAGRHPQPGARRRAVRLGRPHRRGPGARGPSVLHVLGAAMVPGPHHQGGAASGVTVAEDALGRGWRGAGFLMGQERAEGAWLGRGHGPREG